MDIINYAKYENMNRKQLSKHLKKAKKKYKKYKKLNKKLNKKFNKKFNKKLKKSNELIEFLMIKIIKARSNKKHKFITWEESKSFKIFREKFAKMSESERAQLIAEVEAQINRDYGDD
ncbi:MAG: hypothetical protein J6C08_04355 [Campylobacter sp.]|uniref:hypothetical protein n=1 Tax=Campylobacter sp. TaxID=205 RepID=UPI001B16F40B|nr:hypothetical protein [Campylobacter sp.]MBO5063723.1 hypothetical protein [Campylobacter sp.]